MLVAGWVLGHAAKIVYCALTDSPARGSPAQRPTESVSLGLLCNPCVCFFCTRLFVLSGIALEGFMHHFQAQAFSNKFFSGTTSWNLNPKLLLDFLEKAIGDVARVG